MHPYSHDMNGAAAEQRMSRLRGEAEDRRLVRSVRPARPRLVDQAFQTMGQILLTIGKTFKADRRPQLPAV